VLGTQETFCIIIAGLLERDSFDLFLPEFVKPWVIHLRETCCCSTNLCTWRPNTVYKNRHVRRHQFSRNWTKQKPNIRKFTEASRERSGATRGPHNRAAWPRARPRPLCMWPPRSTSDDAPSPIKTPRREKPKHPVTFLEAYRDPPSSSTQDREGPEALPGTLPERGIATGGLLHHHACLRRDV
jgi:hypothetical protein